MVSQVKKQKKPKPTNQKQQQKANKQTKTTKKQNQKTNKIGEMFWFSLCLSIVTNTPFRPSLFNLEVE